MIRDKRFKTIKILIETENIKEFREIFDHFPRTTMAKHMGIHYDKFMKMLKNVEEIKLSELFFLARYFDIDGKVMFDLVYNQHNSKRSVRKK